MDVTCSASVAGGHATHAFNQTHELPNVGGVCVADVAARLANVALRVSYSRCHAAAMSMTMYVHSICIDAIYGSLEGLAHVGLPTRGCICLLAALHRLRLGCCKKS